MGLLDTINAYEALWLHAQGRTPPYANFNYEEERAILERFRHFITETPDCFERTCLAGHITGSGLVVSPNLERVLLTLHRKLGKWLQLGGHADGHAHAHDVAYREVLEESGLAKAAFLSYEHSLPAAVPDMQPLKMPLPFDFDHHDIPARPNEPAHIHYDVRYLIMADDTDALHISQESKDLRWFSLTEARSLTSERSMHRQFDKLEGLAKILRH